MESKWTLDFRRCEIYHRQTICFLMQRPVYVRLRWTSLCLRDPGKRLCNDSHQVKISKAIALHGWLIFSTYYCLSAYFDMAFRALCALLICSWANARYVVAATAVTSLSSHIIRFSLTKCHLRYIFLNLFSHFSRICYVLLVPNAFWILANDHRPANSPTVFASLQQTYENIFVLLW